MILPRGQALLLPAHPGFIWASLIAALAINMLGNMGLWGRAAWAPDWLALVGLFWMVHQPLRVASGVGFALGLAMDVHQGALLGQHALAYTLMGYLAHGLHRRVLGFGLRDQMAHVGLILTLTHALTWLTRWLSGDGGPGWAALLAPVLETALWPLATWVLLAPQRQPPDPDETRPI